MSGTRLLSRKAPATEASDRPELSLADTSPTLPALLIVAHGERGGAGDDRLVHDVAEKMRNSERYRNVQPCFLSKEPSLKSAFAGLSPGPVTIYPLFMSDGYFVKRAIPRSLAEADAGHDPETYPVEISTPFGLSPHLPNLVTDLAMNTAHRAGRAARNCRLLLVAHGSKHDGASRSATHKLATNLAETNSFAGVEQCFLEEVPFLEDRITTIKGPAIAVGLFVGQGMHGAVDLPGAVENSGRSDILLASPLGHSPNLIEIINDDLTT